MGISDLIENYLRELFSEEGEIIIKITGIVTNGHPEMYY